MAEFSTPTRVKCKSKTDNSELNTPIKIPASPFLQQIGYGTGMYVPSNVFTVHTIHTIKERYLINASYAQIHTIIFAHFFLSGVAVYMLERSPKVGLARSPWAVKKWLKGRNNEVNNGRLRLEADVLRQLNHPNIVGFRAFTTGVDGKPCLAMEALDTSLGIYKNE